MMIRQWYTPCEKQFILQEIDRLTKEERFTKSEAVQQCGITYTTFHRWTKEKNNGGFFRTSKSEVVLPNPMKHPVFDLSPTSILIGADFPG